MSSSTKGLKRRGSRWREVIEGWTVDYGYGWADGMPWFYRISKDRCRYDLGAGDCRTLGAARAAARAVVMERETRGMAPHPGHDWYQESPLVSYCWRADSGDWLWRRWTFPREREGTASTLAEARKAAREAQQGA